MAAVPPGQQLPAPDDLAEQAFLSYTAHDPGMRELAQAIFNGLQGRHVPMFFDETSLDTVTGVQWAQCITQAVRASKAVVVLLSPQYCEREWCMRELDMALNAPPEGGRKVVVLLLGVTMDSLKADVEQLKGKWATFTHVSDPEVDVARWATNILHKLPRHQMRLAGTAEPGAERLRLVEAVTKRICEIIKPLKHGAITHAGSDRGGEARANPPGAGEAAKC